MTIGINQKTAPIRFGFLIKPDSNTCFDRAVKVAFSMWGGMYSPILPLYKRFPKSFRSEYMTSIGTKDFYKNSINNFDPDVLIFDEGLDIEYIKEISGDREVIRTKDFIELLINGHANYGIDLTQIISSVINSDFKYQRRDNKKILVPQFSRKDTFLKMYFGSVNETIEKKILEYNESDALFSTPKINLDNLNSQLFNNTIDLNDINNKWIKSSTIKFWKRGYGIYFININRLTDLINYWNLRALGWTIIPMIINHLEHPFFKNMLENYSNWYNNKPNQSKFLTFLISSSTIPSQKVSINELLTNVQKNINKNLNFSFQGWIPRFWEDKNTSDADNAQSTIQYIDSHLEQVDIKDNFVEFNVHTLPFEVNTNLYNEALYKTNLGFSYYSNFEDYAGLIFGIDTIDWVRLTYSGSSKWRLSKSGLNYFVRRRNDQVHFLIPKSLDFFKTFFAKNSYILKETPNGRLAKEVLKNIGGIQGIHFLKNLSSLKIIELFEDGKVVDFSTLVGQIKRNLNLNNPETQSFIKELIENKIIELGAKIQCSICNQRTFYFPRELNNALTCSVCRNEYKIPSHNPNDIIWAYRGIGPFSRNNKIDGLMSVFLTLKLFNIEFAESSGNISSLIGFELAKPKEIGNEVDLAVLVQKRHEDINPPDLCLCECKTFKDFTLKDTKRMKKLGEDFPGSILTFATLKDHLNGNEIKLISRLVKYFRRGKSDRPLNSVLILTVKELLPDNSFDSFSDYKEQIKPYHKYNDWIGNLCELSVQKHLTMETWGSIISKMIEKEMKSRHKEKLVK